MTQDIEQLLIDKAPPPLKQLGARLADLLDADHWNNIEPLLLDAAALLVWQPIRTAPTGDDDFFLVCCDDPADDRSPFVVRGSIFKSARQERTPGHLSLHHLTHWRPLPAKPSRVP